MTSLAKEISDSLFASFVSVLQENRAHTHIILSSTAEQEQRSNQDKLHTHSKKRKCFPLIYGLLFWLLRRCSFHVLRYAFAQKNSQSYSQATASRASKTGGHDLLNQVVKMRLKMS